MEPGGTHQLAGAVCQSGTEPSSPITTLPGFTSSHLEYLLFCKITPGLLQCKTQDSGAILDPSLGLVPAEGMHTRETQGLLLGNHRKGHPGPLSGAGLAHLSSGDSPGPGLRLPPALIDGLLTETLEQLPQFLAHKVS